MKFHELLKQLDNLDTTGDIKSLSVETVIQTQKYFIENIDIKSDSLKFITTRDFYKELSAFDLVNKMKDCKNMVNEEADCFIVVDGKFSP